tara:strand:- start:2803 stop:3261 length:459 start_codon:yes stop_codon:yes gene_type:complete
MEQLELFDYKTCKTCGEEKLDCEFVKADGQHRATRNRCKDCHKKQSDLRKKLRKENPPPDAGICPICQHHTDKWVLDHCHTNETFRGYICTSCNSGIGLLHDDPDILIRASEYLKGSYMSEPRKGGWMIEGKKFPSLGKQLMNFASAVGKLI